MSLSHTHGARARRHAVLVLSAVLCAAPTVSAAMQATTTTAAPRASTARARSFRCEGCSDSTRARAEILFLKFDSLRMEFERRRMSPDERDLVAREVTVTLMALQEFMDIQARGGGARVRVEIDQASGAAAAAVVAGAVPRRMIVVPEKPGYIGVTFAGPMLKDEGAARIVRFLAYPEVASVDPSSPAERAGIIRGDTLLSLNGTDVFDHAFSFTRLLVPDARVTLKMRREGDTKEFRVVVAEAPNYAISRMMPAVPLDAPMPPVVVGPPAPARPDVRAQGAPSAEIVPRSLTPVPGEERDRAYAYSGRVMFIGTSVAGARLEVINEANEGLGKALGTKEGLLVMRVVPGSLADRSGLRDGDVILTCAGQTMRTVQDFQRVLAGWDRWDDGVKLVILRDKKKKDLLLK